MDSEEQEFDAEEALDELEVTEETPEEEPEQEAGELLTMNYRGEQVQVTRDKAIELAQKGFDYETKMAALKETNADYAGYEAMKEWMAANPDEAAKVKSIIAGETEEPQQEEELDDDWLSDFEDEEEAPRLKQRKEANSEVQALKRQVDELRAERDQKRAKEETEAMGNLLRAEVAKYPELEEAGELAYAPILGVLSTRPDADPSQVVKAVAAQFKELMTKTRSGYVKKKVETLEETPAEVLKGKNPTILRKPTFGREDMDSGDLRRAVLAHFNTDKE